MALALGVDTGGTYTDAVLVRDETTVVAKAKALTTRGDLAQGIGGAVGEVLASSGVAPADIGMAALSTTLATNALVEGHGERAALVMIGFTEAELGRHGLGKALAGEPVLFLEGGHDHGGGEAAELDLAALETWLDDLAPVSGFAVAGRFATRNPAHELRIAAVLRERTGAPVSMSHALSAKLNGPKRALTALLNARLIGMIDRLIARAGEELTRLGVTAPLMVVRGDGALISAAQAREAPIETILSGPAASIVGARWLTGRDAAVVSDIGGTTTDVAILQGGRPKIDPQGARVGAHRTMVEAVAMHTFGLGGDSEVRAVSEGLVGGLILGPRRVVPVGLVATLDPDKVHHALDEALRAPAPGEYDGQFAMRVPGRIATGLSDREARVFERVGDGVTPLAEILRNRIEAPALRALSGRGLVQVAGLTPSDASLALALLDRWDREAAEKALMLLARRRRGDGALRARTAPEMAQQVLDQLTAQSMEYILRTVLTEDSEGFGDAPEDLATHPLMARAFAGHRGLLAMDARLDVPLIGLGASASTHYPAIAKRLNAQVDLPEDGDVANAIGAVVGRITIRKTGTMTVPNDGQFRLHLTDGLKDFADCDQAMTALEAVLTEEARAAAQAAGAGDLRITVTQDIRKTETESREVVVEGSVMVEATGRPRIA